MNNTKEVLDLMQEIQKECHEFANQAFEQIVVKEKCSNQDVTNVFFFHKLAEIELRLKALEKHMGRSKSYLSMHTPLGGCD
jgi:hypothetical protein